MAVIPQVWYTSKNWNGNFIGMFMGVEQEWAVTLVSQYATDL